MFNALLVFLTEGFSTEGIDTVSTRVYEAASFLNMPDNEIDKLGNTE